MKKLLLLLGFIVIVAGCQKNQSPSPKTSSANQLSAKQVDVGTLSNYLEKLTSLKAGTVSYNANSKQFAAFGRDQISLDALTNLYNLLPKNQAFKTIPRGNFTTTYMAEPPPGGGGTGGGSGGTGGGGSVPTPTPFSDPADSLISYNNSLVNNITTSATLYDNNSSTEYPDVTQGAVSSYTIAVTGSGGGTIAGSNLNVKYNQSQTVKVTVTISVPHDPTTGKVAPFTINATLELFTGNILFPTPIPNYGITITEKNVKATDVVTSLSFNLAFPVATAGLNGQHFCLYWNNASAPDAKVALDPVYTIVVQGLPNTSGTTVTEQTGPIIYLYRMFYAPGGEHFYTTSNTEKYQLLHQQVQLYQSFWSYLINGKETPNVWTDEGNIGQVYNFKAQGTVPLYRLFNGSVHMFTIDPAERANIIATLGYHDEGISGYVFSTEVAGSQPVYRYRGTTSTGHFFTTNYNEIGSGSGYGYVYEGIAYYDLSPSN
jgi:hypothetical protein